MTIIILIAVIAVLVIWIIMCSVLPPTKAETVRPL